MNRTACLSFWKKLRPHLAVCLFFLVITFVYLSPKLQELQIHQGDVEKYIGASQEVREYYEKEGIGSSWTGSMFSGMPTYAISTQGGPVNVLNYLEYPLKALGASDAGALFTSMLTFYILILVLGARIPVAMLGAIAFAFSSYSIIILQAGHVTKAWVIAYIPLAVAGLLLILRNKFLWGGLIFTLALALQIKNNHPQITYYLTLFCCIIYLAYVIRWIRKKDWKPLYLSFMTLTGGIIVAFLCNLGILYATYETGQESIRGKSELSHQVDGKEGNKSGGLDKDYAFAWSYGVEETFTLLIPNFYGGESWGMLDKDSNLAKQLVPDPSRVEKIPALTYWGEQPFTSGPVYLGAIVCLLFVFSLFVIRHSIKWWILGATVFFILLSWGKNFDSFNTFWLHYLPFYNKFRAVSMSLVIPQFTFAFLAAWGLMELFRKDADKEYLKKSALYSLLITGGLCLFYALFAPLDFRSSLDIPHLMQAYRGQKMEWYKWYVDTIALDRKALMQADAFRSLLFILLGVACLYVLIQTKKEARVKYTLYILVGLVLVDLWGIDKRYLNESHFVKRKDSLKAFALTEADRQILKDKDPSFRVLSLQDPFNNSYVSYRHKSIGGYSAAKLRRYQELIELKLGEEVSKLQQSTSLANIEQTLASAPALNMLNMRYLIFHPSQAPFRNPYAFGNAWFVDSVRFVDNADEEMTELSVIDPRKTALVDKRFKDMIQGGNLIKDSTASVELVSYKPDRLEYRYRSSQPGILVFSEVYYPYGWKASIDGNPVSHFRTNWILRGMEVPAGEHTIQFWFQPDTYNVSRWIATIFSGLLVIFFIFLVVKQIKKTKC